MDFSTLSFRKEVLDYLCCCESLLAALSAPGTSSFSQEEQDVLAYSVTKLQKVLILYNNK